MSSHLKIFATFIVLTSVSLLAGDKPAYRLYSEKGKSRDYSDLVKEAGKADIIFFGEMHANPMCHWLELQLTKDLHEAVGKRLILGGEMFESDDQLVLDEYLAKDIRSRNFEEEAKLWPNYKTDYKPLIEFALSKSLPFIATNVPRRYSAMVNKGGFEVLDSLDREAKRLIAPLPISYDPDVRCYRDILEQIDSAHRTPNIPKAQALKDATMAHFILKNYKQGSVFLHYNGSYHSDNHEGIIWYIRQQRPDLKIVTISSVEQKDIMELDSANRGLGNFILCVPEDMTKTR